MLHQAKKLLVVFAMLTAMILALPQLGSADTFGWKGLTWNYTSVGVDPYINSSGHLVGTGNMGASTADFGTTSFVGKDLWIKASFLTPEWGINPAIFADGFTESNTTSRFHIGLMGPNGEYYGARHTTSSTSTPNSPTHIYQPRDPSDVGSEHTVALHKAADGQTMELWFDQHMFALIGTTDPGGGDILTHLPTITLGSFMPTNRGLPYTFTDFEVVLDGVSSQTPEPATGLLVISAAGVFGLLRRRRSKTKIPC